MRQRETRRETTGDKGRQDPREGGHTIQHQGGHLIKELFWFLPQVVGLIYLGGWQYIPGICLVYTPQFGLSIYRPYIQRFARNYFLLISTSSLKNSRTGAHVYPNRKTGKKFQRMPKKQPPPNTNTIKNRRLAPTYCSWYRGAI